MTDAPAPLPDLAAVFEEARLRREAEDAEREKESATKEAEFEERRARMLGRATPKPGDRAGVRCSACGLAYVFDDQLRIQHDPAGCTPKPKATPEIDLRAVKVRRTYDPSEDNE